MIAVSIMEDGVAEAVARLIDLDVLTAQANELSPLPASAVRLASLVSSHHYDVSDVVDIVAFDQALTLKLLRCANSAARASSVPVSTVSEAVMRLGSAQILSLAVAGHARPLLQHPVPEYGLGEGALWRHAVASALVAEAAPAYCRASIPPESFTSALLHDIGKLVMARFLSPEILGYLEQARVQGGLGALQAEKEVLEVHHAELGGIVAQHWRLPDCIVRGIIHHHTPHEGNDVICDAVYLANITAKKVEANLAGQTCDVAADWAVLERLGIDWRHMEDLTAESTAKFAAVSARYNAG